MLASLGDDTAKLVIDLSCRRKGDTWFVAMNKWQTLTEMEITKGACRFSVLIFLRLTWRKTTSACWNRIARSF